MTTHAAEVRLELVSHPRYLGAVRDFIAAATRALGFADNQASQIALAVDEAVANVMRHGYAGRCDGRIWLAVIPVSDTAKGPGVRIVIEDEARQVEPAAIRGRDLADIRPGGLGVHIIREVTDSAVYEKRAGAGMRLTIEKYLSSPAKACDACGCSDPGTTSSAQPHG
ncbi:MAG: anti-sigma factor antagonist [Phycisphaerae bacterium]|nr:MAG: anti-sigma factor antagonist [Phycisphaerae bacterium]